MNDYPSLCGEAEQALAGGPPGPSNEPAALDKAQMKLLLERLLEASLGPVELAAELGVSLEQIGRVMTDPQVASIIEGLQRLCDARLQFRVEIFRRTAIGKLAEVALKSDDEDLVRRTCVDLLSCSAGANSRRGVDAARALALLQQHQQQSNAAMPALVHVSVEAIQRAFELHDGEHDSAFDFDANVPAIGTGEAMPQRENCARAHQE